MVVRIEDQVFQTLTEFYEFSLAKHPALDEATVVAKEKRLIEAMKGLDKHASAHPLATRHMPWVRKGYLDFPYEGFHFGYKIETLPSGEKVIVIYEVCHDLLYY